MTSQKQVRLGYTLSHFLRFDEQLATRLEDHQTAGNIVCHLIAAPMLGIGSIALLDLMGGYWLAIILQTLLTLWCLYNDLLYGVVYTAFSMSSFILQTSYLSPNLGVSSTLILFCVAVFIQLGVGHGLFEQRPPNELEGIVKGDGYLFAILDFLCEIVPGTFHFYSIASLKVGLRPSLNKKVNLELMRIQKLIKNR